MRGGLGAVFDKGRGSYRGFGQGFSAGLGDLRSAPKFIKAGDLFKDGSLLDDLVLPPGEYIFPPSTGS
jgi:hypothetical protein